MFIAWGANNYVSNPDYAQSGYMLLPIPGNVYPVFIPSTALVFTPTILGTQDMQLFIAGQPVEWRESTMNIHSIAGAIGTCTFQIHSATTYRPNVFDEVIFYRKGKRRFGGFVQSLDDMLEPKTQTHNIQVNCVDYNGYLDRIVIAKLYTIPLGGLAWIIVFDIITRYLAQFGVTFAGFASSGAGVGEVLFHYVTGAQAIAQLVATAPSIYFWIDAFKLAHYSPAFVSAPAGFGAAPYSLSETSENYYDFKVSVDGTLYRNKQWVLPSANLLSLRVETFTGDGTTTGFFTLYVLSNPPVVTVNGNVQTVATLGGPFPTGWTWYFISGAQGVFQRPGDTPLGVTDTLAVAYPNPFSLAVSAQNDTEIAAHGLVEAIVQPQNVIDIATAQSMANGILAAYCPNPPQIITYVTTEIDDRTGLYAAGEDGRWLTPGMSITINKTIPATSGGGIVQEIVSQEEGLTLFRHTVTVRQNTGTLDAITAMQSLSQGAQQASNNNATEMLGFELALTVAGLTNPGLATGPVLNTQIFNYDGVFSYWSILFASNPPTGADIVIDAKLNGVSIFPANDALRIVLPAGQSTEAQGYLFSANNLAVKKGDKLTLNVIQKGLTIPGSDGLVRIVTVR